MAARVKPKENGLRPQKAPASRKVQRPVINENDVRSRAYEIYLARGDTPGDALGDWLRAERELREESKRLPGDAAVS